MSDIEMRDTPLPKSISNKKTSLPVVIDEQLLVYYDRLFPVEEIIRWLSYGNDSKHPEACSKFIQKREFCFTLRGDVFVRYQSFPDARCLRDALVQKCPAKIDIGPIYNVDPKCRATYSGVTGGFHCVERELVFDIDMSDYDDVRTCCTAESICNKDWAYMAAAILILDAALREDFGFKHILWVYSGRRGIHCWVCDKRARLLSDKERSSIVSYFTVYVGQEKGQAKINVLGPPHPAIQRALQICNDIWINRILPEQQLFESEHHAEAIFQRIPDAACIEHAKRAMPNKDEDINQTVWRALEIEVQKKHKGNAVIKQKELVQGLTQIILSHVYPRLDLEVSKKMNHLLKAPFCVHPKTGKICVPIDPQNVWDFYPEEVPTLADILQQLDTMHQDSRGSEVQSTELGPYIDYFQEFLSRMNTENFSDLTSKSKTKSQDFPLAW